jgi:hypothetical protein
MKEFVKKVSEKLGLDPKYVEAYYIAKQYEFEDYLEEHKDNMIESRIKILEDLISYELNLKVANSSYSRILGEITAKGWFPHSVIPRGEIRIENSYGYMNIETHGALAERCRNELKTGDRIVAIYNIFDNRAILKSFKKVQ